jgi:ribonuclease G
VGQEILINVTPQETRVAVLEQGVAQELHIERSSSLGIVGNVYRGKVCRVLPGMQSAFVEIGLQRAAFLHAADIMECHINGEPQTERPIQEVLFEGQSIIVQVIKEPISTKGARLTTEISIAGRFLVFLPHQDHIGVSQRIEDEAEREHLRNRLLGLLPEKRTGGFIIRTMSETASDAELLADIEYLQKVWAKIQVDSQHADERSLVFYDLSLPRRMLRDVVNDQTVSIRVDSKATYEQLKEFAELYVAKAVKPLYHYQGERPIFDFYNIEKEIERALSRKVELTSGGYVSGKNLSDTIFKTNLEAAQAIARQLRLRNLGGIIIIDFIDMDTDEQRETVLEELKKAVGLDRARTGINGFTSLGLVEMTRKRTRESLAHLLCEPCDVCNGRGEHKTAQTICYEIMRELLRESKQFNAKEFKIIASTGVIDLLLDEEAQSLANLSDFINKRVTLQADNQYAREAFDIVWI